jgi:MoxR-like ATPase
VLRQSAQALALFDGLSFVTPELIQECVIPVIAHRIMLDPQALLSGVTSQSIVQQILESEAVPV